AWPAAPTPGSAGGGRSRWHGESMPRQRQPDRATRPAGGRPSAGAARPPESGRRSSPRGPTPRPAPAARRQTALPAGTRRPVGSEPARQQRQPFRQPALEDHPGAPVERARRSPERKALFRRDRDRLVARRLGLRAKPAVLEQAAGVVQAIFQAEGVADRPRQ